MPLFGKNKMSLLGVDISSTSIKVLGLGGNEQRYRVESYAVEPLPGNPVMERNITDVHVVGETIARAVKKSGTRIKTAACAVSGAAVITKVISMPSVLSEDRSKARSGSRPTSTSPIPWRR